MNGLCWRSKSNSGDLREVLVKAYSYIYCVATLMRHFNPEEDVNGGEVNDMAELLFPPPAWLEQVYGTFVGYRLVREQTDERHEETPEGTGPHPGVSRTAP